MSSLLKPTCDPELAEILKHTSPNEALAPEVVSKQRKEIEPFCTPEAVFIDPEIEHEEVTIPSPVDDIALTIVRSKKSARGLQPAFYWIHGGSMVIGTRYFFLGSSFDQIKQLDAILISVEYRLAPEHPSPANSGQFG
jgi:acetyl esterase/lipase